MQNMQTSITRRTNSPKLKRYGVSIICVLKKFFYFEINLLLGKYTSFSIFLFTRFFKPHAIMYRKIFLLFLCMKLLLIDPFSISNIPVQAQTNTSNNFNLIQAQSLPVSFNTSILPSTITLNSLPVSYSIAMSASFIKLSSLPVSFNTSIFPTTITLSSKPVSYSLSKTADLLKISSLPVSYSLNSFSGNLIKTSSASVSYKIFNGTPLLQAISPNLLPISQSGSSILVSLNGENFAKEAVASIGTLKINTEYKSSKELIATIPANYLNKENSFEIFVTNPPPKGSVSQGLFVRVVDPVPIAKINAAPNIGVAPQIVTFDGRDTEDLLAKYFGEELSYSWNFGDNDKISNENPNISTNPVATHKYSKPGKYTVSLNVVNAYGKSSKITKEIEVREKNFAPEVTYETNITSGDVPVTVSFTSMILDIENDSISYFWDFGDGNSSTDQAPQHTYTIAGKYKPALTVTDSLGAKSVINSSKLTFLPLNNLPICQVTAIPRENILKRNENGFFISTVQFSSNSTYDPDGEEIKYLWDFGDGEKSEETNPKHEYQNPGEYKVILSVTDIRNGKTIKESEVNIFKPSPTSSASIAETTGSAPFEVSFDGSNSQDYDGMAVSLKWDFGDGATETTDSTQAQIKHTYQNPGVYLITLTATTSDNRFTKINPGNIIVGPNKNVVGQITKLEGDEKGIAGNANAMVKLSAKGSYDPLDSALPLKYKWSWSALTYDVSGNLKDVSEEINSSIISGNDQETFDFTFTNPGQYTPVLEIEKSDGNKSKFLGETYTISQDQSPVAIAKITSEQTSGKAGLEVAFDGSESYDPKANGGIKILTWDFGDGEKSNEISPKHIYSKEGTFTPTLVVADNENKIGYSQTNSIKITNEPEDNKNLLTRKTLLQVTYELTEEEIKESIDSMVKEALNSFDQEDNQKPEIGPITVEPKIISPGSSVKLSCFLKDNVALSNFGYTLIDQSGKILEEKVIDLVNNDDKILRDEIYLEEQILIPKELPSGTYDLKLTATDTSNNQLAKVSQTNNENEEVIVNIEVSNIESLNNTSPNPDVIIEHSQESPVSREIQSRTLEENEEKRNSYLRGKNILVLDEKLEIEIENIPKNLIRLRANDLINKKEENLKFQTAEFSVTGVTGISNPWISISPSKTNSLLLYPIAEKDGYLSIGTKGSLISKYFANWSSTNIYVDYKKIGNVFWAYGAGISFDSNTANPVKYVQFRPVNSTGQEMPPETWSGDFFTFTKITQPQLTSLSQTESTAGRGAFDLNLYGSNFRESSKVYFDGYPLTPFESSPAFLKVKVPASLASYIGIKPVFVRNSDGSQSSTIYYTIKANQINPCSLGKTLPQRRIGADSTTILNGNNTYLSFPSATIEGNGSIIIPFCLDGNYDIKTSLTLTHIPLSTTKCNDVNFRLDGIPIGHNKYCGYPGTFTFENLNTSTLTNDIHNLEVSFSAPSSDKLLVEEALFSIGGGPVISSLSPGSVSLEGQNRTLTINGRNFNQGTTVYLDGEITNKTSVSGSQITVLLPDKFQNSGTYPVQLIGDGKSSSILSLVVRDKIEIIPSLFKVTPPEPFPGNSFDIELKVKDKSGNLSNLIYIAHIGVFDPDGNIIFIPNISNNLSTITLNGTKESQNENGDIITVFRGSVPLGIHAKAGNYKVIASVIRNSSFGSDYSSFEAFKYLTTKALGLSANENLIPASHKLIFTPKPAVLLQFGIEESNSENVGFAAISNKVIQDNQEIKFKAVVSKGTEYASKLRFNFKSGYGRESGITSSDNATFKYNNSNVTDTTPLTFRSGLDVYWAEGGIQTKIAAYSGTTVYVYPNYKPIAKTKIFSEKYPLYADKPPLITGFIDLDSYDPNQKLSRTIDFVNPLNNSWELFKGIAGQNENVISLPLDGKVSDDKKTFISGSLFSPGTYFAKLTVQDQSGQSDTASTESVTVTYPHQKIIVFASTDPQDKKIYDPGTSQDGIPVKFKSNVTVLSGNPTLSYKWDFGDSSCMRIGGGAIGRIGELPEDCTSPNPTHIYYDGKRSFNGQSFIDRRSVTPKLTVSARFMNGTTETWEASTGTITFNAEPNFVLFDLKAEPLNGIVPLTVNLMIDSATARSVNATVTKYELDWGDGTKEQADITFDELKSKTFTHTYTEPNTYLPKLKVFILESGRTFTFNVADITAAGTGQAGVYLLDDLSTTSFTNQPIVTFMVLALFPNPNDPNNSLKIKVKDEDGNENVTELDPGNSLQTLSLSEGKNIYHFETTDSSGEIWMSEIREIVVDQANPSISNLLASVNPQNNFEVIITGNLVEDNLQKVELQLDENTPIILSSDEIVLIQEETNEHKFTKTISNISETYHNVTIKVTDLAGNTSEESLLINKQNNVFSTLRAENQISNDFKSPSIISNKSEHIYDLFEITKDVISGEPFDLQLFSCFNDDGGLGQSGKEHNMVETFFAIDSHKLTVSKNNSEPVDITASLNNISRQAIDKCFNIQGFGIQYKKPDCNYDSLADLNHCFDACTRLDGHICNAEIINTTPVNKYQKDIALFDTSLSNSDLLKQWDIGSYELKFTINSSQDSLSLYGTNLGKNSNNPLTSQIFTYKINVIRKPDIKTEIAQASKKLKFDEGNEIRFKVIVSDNIQFTQERKPKLDLQNKKWTGLIEPASPIIEVISETIDSNDPRKYVFELKTNLKPKSLKKIDLEIPVLFPPDYFNPTGINYPVKITFGKIEGSFAAEITSPADGTFITGKTNISSTVTKPQNLQDGLNLFNNCKKSVINYGIKTFENENIIPIASKPLEVNPIKIASKGKDLIEQIDFKDLLNFNLKNVIGFKDDFLSGSIFGPIELYGEYSTACTDKNLEYNSTPKALTLFDYLRIIKAKCKHLNNSSSTTCEITASNNTFSDNYEVIISPNPNDCKPIITGENKLTRTYKFSCLPPDISTFEVKLKREQKFLEKIQEKINLTPSIPAINITTNENVIFADKKNISVKNVEGDSLFSIGDINDKKVTVDGKTISVQELNQLLYDLGFLQDLDQNGYTEKTRDAFGTLVNQYNCIKNSDIGNLKYQVHKGSCQENIFPDFKAQEEEVKIATKIQDFMRGIKESYVELYNEIHRNPILASFVIGFAVASGVIITTGAAWINIYTAGVLVELGAIGVMVQIEDIKNKLAGYFNESDSFKAGYIFGEAGKFVGLSVVIGFASKGLTNLSYTIQGVKQAQILSEQGHKDLANAIYEQVSRINNATDDVIKTGLKNGLDGVLKTVDDIQTGEIFKDFQRLWTGVTQEEISSIKLNALKLFNDIVAKMQQQEELFKIYETDPGGYETGVLRNNLIDKRFQSILQSLGKDLAETIKNAISERVNGTVSSLNQYFANKGLILIGDVIPPTKVPPRLSTFMKISDFKKYHLQGTEYEEAAYETIIADIKSGVLNPSKIKGELSTRSGIRWWTDTSKIQELRQSGKLTKEYITGDNGVALDYNTLDPLETHIEVIISKENIDFYVPVSSAGGRKYVPSPNNPDLYNGKSFGGLYEIYSNKVPADITSGHAVGIDVAE